MFYLNELIYLKLNNKEKLPPIVMLLSLCFVFIG